MVCSDIQYKEGILEFIEQFDDIDIIIISELIQGNIELEELIEKIKKINSEIKIIIFLEKINKTMEESLLKKGAYKIFYNNEIEIKDLIKLINYNNKCNEDYLKEEINNLKKIILEKESKNNLINKRKNKKLFINKNRIINKIKKYKLINLVENKNSSPNKNKIISIIGPGGTGKSIITVNLSKINSFFNNKNLIIDLDPFNNSIHTIFGVSIYPNKNNKKNNILNIINEEINFNNYIIKINKKIDLLNIYSFLESNNNLKTNLMLEQINLLINKLKNKYDFIIIDNTSKNYELIKNSINISNITIFISGTNLLEINKSIKLLDILINENNINKNKFNIIFNKKDINSIEYKILKNIFNDFNILGELNYRNSYNKLINKNNKSNFINKKIRKEYLIINNKLKLL